MFTFFLFALAIAATLFTYISASKSSKSSITKSDLDDLNYTQVEETNPVPVLFGTRLIPMSLIWYGDMKSSSIYMKKKSMGKTSKTLVGYAYFVGQLYIMAMYVQKIIEFRMGDTVKARKSSGLGNPFSAMTGKVSDTNGSGAGKSSIYWTDGTQTTANSYAASKTGFAGCYPQTALMIMPRVFIGDGCTTIPTYSVLAQYFPDMFGTGYQKIQGEGTNNVSANPADAIYFILTVLCGIESSKIDVDSFKSVQATLYTEGLGISFVLSSAKSAKDWIDAILTHIDGIFYNDESTGKMKLKLLRGDYDEDSLLIIDESIYDGLEFTRGTQDSVFSHLRITWTSRHIYSGTDDGTDTFTWGDATYVCVNPAVLEMLGYNKEKNVDLKMFIDMKTVSLVMSRLKRRAFYPLAVVSFECSPNAYDPLPSDVVKFSNDTLGISEMVIRITEIQRSDCRDQKITVKAIQDIFSLGDEEVIDITEDTNEITDYTLDDECQYVTIKDCSAEVAPDGKAIMVLAAQPATGTAMGYKVQIGGQSLGTYSFSGTGTLTAAYVANLLLDTNVGFTITGCVGIESTTNSIGAWQRCGTVAIIDSGGDNWELISVRTITENTDGTFTFSGIIRAMADTPNMTHASGARVWVLGEDIFSYDPVDVSGLALNAAISVDVTAFNHVQSSPTTTVSHTYGYRPETPYSPANLTVSGNTIFWTACTRHSGAHNVNADTIPASNSDTEGSWVVYKNGNELATVTTPEYTTTDTGTFTVKSLLNGRYSAGKSITK
jgi:hypothetical protein